MHPGGPDRRIPNPAGPSRDPVRAIAIHEEADLATTTIVAANATAAALQGTVATQIDALFGAATLPEVTYTAGSTFPTGTTATDYGAVVFASAQAGTVSVPAQYPLVYVTTAAGANLSGLSASSHEIVALSGNVRFNANGAPSLVLTGNAADGTGAGSAGSVITVEGNSSVVAGEGSDTVIATAGNNAIATGVGSNLVLLSGGGNNLVASEGNDIIAAGNGNDTVVTTGSALVFGGSSGGTLTVSNAVDTVTVVGGGGHLSINGGTGGGTFFAGSGGQDTMVAGQQSTAMIGGNGDVLTAIGSAGDLLVAGVGNETLNGSANAGATSYFGGSGAALVQLGSGPSEYVGGNGTDTIVAGSGSDTFFAGTGSELFRFVKGDAGSSYTLGGFTAGTDHISLQGYSSGATVTSSGSGAQASTTVSLEDGTRINLFGVASLAGGTFV